MRKFQRQWETKGYCVVVGDNEVVHSGEDGSWQCQEESDDPDGNCDPHGGAAARLMDTEAVKLLVFIIF